MTPRYFREYQASKALAASNVFALTGANEFFSLLMAAMRLAGSDEFAKLANAFPDVADELRKRYNAPGGVLVEEEMTALINIQENNKDEEEDYDGDEYDG